MIELILLLIMLGVPLIFLLAFIQISILAARVAPKTFWMLFAIGIVFGILPVIFAGPLTAAIWRNEYHALRLAKKLAIQDRARQIASDKVRLKNRARQILAARAR